MAEPARGVGVTGVESRVLVPLATTHVWSGIPAAGAWAVGESASKWINRCRTVSVVEQPEIDGVAVTYRNVSPTPFHSYQRVMGNTTQVAPSNWYCSSSAVTTMRPPTGSNAAEVMAPNDEEDIVRVDQLVPSKTATWLGLMKAMISWRMGS